MSERIVLTIPSAPGYRSIASLVLGGFGSRLDLSYERMDDLQLALLSVLESASEEMVTLELEACDGSLALAIGPMQEGVGADGSLATVLGRLVEEAEETQRDGRTWLHLRLARPPAP